MSFLNISYLLILILLIFLSGIIGLVLNRKNILIIIISIELILLSINFNFILFSLYLDDIIGQIFVMFILCIAAAESAIGLSILTAYHKIKSTILIEKIKTLKS